MSIPFFVGTYTIKMGHVPDPQGAGVTAHLLSTATGEISLIGTASTDLTGNNPTYVCKGLKECVPALTANVSNVLYTVSEVDNGEAKAFKYTIDDKGCNFELLNSLPTQVLRYLLFLISRGLILVTFRHKNFRRARLCT
jgi:hypothetical protein